MLFYAHPELPVESLAYLQVQLPVAIWVPLIPAPQKN